MTYQKGVMEDNCIYNYKKETKTYSLVTQRKDGHQKWQWQPQRFVVEWGDENKNDVL